MHAYTFRIVLEDYDDFYADIEVAANQNFEDLHKVIVELAELKGNEMASFYFCDYSWKRKSEIALVDLSEPDEEDATKPLIMKDCILAKTIYDPHQRIMYVYDFLNMITFYLELKKISEAQKGAKYPRVSKKCGELPKQGAVLPQKFITEFEDEAAVVFDANENDFEGEEGEEPFGEFGEEFSSESTEKSSDEF